MEGTTELVVYLGAGIVIAILVAALALHWKLGSDVRTLISAHNDTPGSGLEKLSREEFALRAHDYWVGCDQSTEPRTFYVADEGNFNKSMLFTTYISLNWCTSIQSKNLSCGYREDVNMSNIILPKVVKVHCSNSTLVIE